MKPEVFGDIKKATELNKEQSSLKEAYDVYQQYKKILIDCGRAAEALWSLETNSKIQMLPPTLSGGGWLSCVEEFYKVVFLGIKLFHVVGKHGIFLTVIINDTLVRVFVI